MSYQPQFLAPQGAGRPQERNERPLTIENFSGGTEVFFPLTDTSNSPLARTINARCFNGRTFDRRLGKVLTGAAGGAGKVYMSASMQVTNGNDIQFRLIDGAGAGVQLQKYTPGTDTWSNVGNNIGTADDRVDWFWTSIKIAGEDRLYFTNGVSEMQYTNGTTISTVTGVYCKYITNVGDVLFAGHFTDVFTENYGVYAKANSHQFFKDADGSLAASTNTFPFPGQINNVRAFGGLVYVFLKSDGLYEVDLADLTARQVSTHGTIAPKSVDSGWDIMIWADQYAIWGQALGGNVLELSKRINDIYSNVTVTNLMQMTGHINSSGQYELDVGDLTYDGVTYTNYAFIYEIERSRFENQNIWVEDYGRIFANNMVNWTNSYGFTQTYAGSRTNQTTWQLDYGYYDDGGSSGINSFLQTKDFRLADEKKEVTFGDIYLEYSNVGSDVNAFTIECRVDGGDWIALKASAIDLAQTTGKFSTIRLQGIAGIKGRTLAVRMYSGSTQPFRLYRINIYYSYTEAEFRPT